MDIKTTGIIFCFMMIVCGCSNTPINELPVYGGIEKTPSELDEKDIYIPKDLDDCFAELEKILKPEDIKKMKEGTENDMIQYHFGLGMWIRNNWGLRGESHLAKWFNAQGIKHPDDMSGIILDSFWRHLNSKPIKLNEQVKYYQDYWKKMEVK